MAPAQPELKKYLDKRLFVQLNGSRKVIGVLRGYDVRQMLVLGSLRPVFANPGAQVFLNIVLDDAFEETEGGNKTRLGMVVIRGNSVVMLEAMERIGGDDRQHR
ncbi:putative small nuclear ribonucleoprotein G [Beauveria bassiana D1-5]|uniref:Small nuclear ribonucleoprotein G n=1 Tax=Beauveria bassiana D1-5 TaxID=1245745 RepID=A0A0A2VX75_BEABA|nr:putative small nuclear ribonucleoprotein G [Beauveria bassiana D1-5]